MGAAWICAIVAATSVGAPAPVSGRSAAGPSSGRAGTVEAEAEPSGARDPEGKRRRAHAEPGAPGRRRGPEGAEATDRPAAALVPTPPPERVAAAARRPKRPKRRRRRPKPRRVVPKGHPDCDGRVPIHEHVVQKGEHLGRIAGKYGVRRRDLVRLNPHLRDPDLIHPGQRVRVCPEILPRVETEIFYTVQPGDTLTGIAAQYDLSVEALLELQKEPLEDPNRIRPGERVRIVVQGPVLPAFRPFDPERVEGDRLVAGMQLPPGAHYHVKRPHLAWGTPHTVRLIQKAIDRYRRRRPGGPKIFVGDISKRGGGKLPPHLSHRAGRDVDIGYVRRGKNANNPRFTVVDDRTLDVPRTWELVKAFLETNEVRFIFMDYRVQKKLYEYARSQGVPKETLDELFQYPRGRHRAHGIIRHWRSHRDHFHVRFRK